MYLKRRYVFAVAWRPTEAARMADGSQGSAWWLRQASAGQSGPAMGVA